MAKKREGPDRYFQLHHYMLKTEAWRSLSAAARAVYVQLGARYNGTNNGKLACSVRDAAEECRLDKNTAMRAFKELVALGFIEETRHGSMSRKTRIASEWRLTAFRCDLTGALKTCAFMQAEGRRGTTDSLAADRKQAVACLKRRPVKRPSLS
jgi:Helix-turn-helix domain